jgi:hypothetical protein
MSDQAREGSARPCKRNRAGADALGRRDRRKPSVSCAEGNEMRSAWSQTIVLSTASLHCEWGVGDRRCLGFRCSSCSRYLAATRLYWILLQLINGHRLWILPPQQQAAGCTWQCPSGWLPCVEWTRMNPKTAAPCVSARVVHDDRLQCSLWGNPQFFLIRWTIWQLATMWMDVAPSPYQC